MRVSSWVVHRDASHWPRYSNPELIPFAHRWKDNPLSSPLVIVPITPIYNHTAYPHRIHSSDPKARGQTATPRDMRLHCHPAPSYRAQHAHCHSKTTGLSGHQAHHFHFISATPLQTQHQYFQPSHLEPPASSLNPWRLGSPWFYCRENLYPAKLPFCWFYKPRSAPETPGFL